MGQVDELMQLAHHCAAEPAITIDEEMHKKGQTTFPGAFHQQGHLLDKGHHNIVTYPGR